METSSFPSLEGLSDIGLRGGVDMRPTLLRVLTDLYVQKPTHTLDEERHYTELALRLLDSVDVQTRSAIATRLARHLSPPGPVVERLAADLPEVAAALRTKASAPPDDAGGIAQQDLTAGTIVDAVAAPAERSPGMRSDVARELNEIFFAANANERRLILLNLDVVIGTTAGGSVCLGDADIGRKLESAALARKREDFVNELARSLRISRELARRIAGDELGEPILVATKALGIPRDLIYRILLFVNTAIGHSVERVHALAMLYDEMSAPTAQDLVAVWQALNINQETRRTGTRWSRPANERPWARPAASVARAPAAAPKIAQRDAS